MTPEERIKKIEERLQHLTEAVRLLKQHAEEMAEHSVTILKLARLANKAVDVRLTVLEDRNNDSV